MTETASKVINFQVRTGGRKKKKDNCKKGLPRLRRVNTFVIANREESFQEPKRSCTLGSG